MDFIVTDSMKEFDVAIVGAGPAGSATALELAQVSPDLAARTILLEKSIFPRKKLCAGGVTRHADHLLKYLGVQVQVPSFPVHAARLRFEELEFTIPWRNAFRVVRREEFDTALARAAQARGVQLCEGEPVRELVRDDTGVTLITPHEEYRAKVVIGADGANSVVRSKLGLARWDRISRLLEILTPVDAAQSPEFVEHTAVFDFTPMLQGVQGYYWDFPSIKQGVPTMNRGLFDSRVRPERLRAELKPVFEAELQARGLNLDAESLMGHPERWFDPHTPHSAPRVVLAGDAAGTEPLIGEGISHALNFGILAARAVQNAFVRGDFSFRDYNRLVSHSALGRRLRLKHFLAHFFYANNRRWQYRLAWHVAQLVFR